MNEVVTLYKQKHQTTMINVIILSSSRGEYPDQEGPKEAEGMEEITYEAALEWTFRDEEIENDQEEMKSQRDYYTSFNFQDEDGTFILSEFEGGIYALHAEEGSIFFKEGDFTDQDLDMMYNDFGHDREGDLPGY